MDLHTWISIMEIWSSVANCGNPPLWGFVAFGIPRAPYFVVKLFISLRNSNKCPHINPDMWSLNFRNYTALQPDYSLYIWLIYGIVKITKNIWVLSSRWMAIYRVGSINFDVALISCLRGKLTAWLALIPKTHKTITNVIQSVFTQLMSFGFSDRHGEHTISLFWIIVVKATWLGIWSIFCEFISEQIWNFFLSHCVKYLIESLKTTCV